MSCRGGTILRVISLTTEHDGDVVDLIMDEDGLADLERILGWLRDGLDTHYHLMSAEWGGDGLDVEEPLPGRVHVHKFTVRYFASAG